MALIRASWEVLKSDKKLLIFPLLSGIATILVSLSFMVPVFLSGGAALENPTPLTYAFMFLVYLVLAFITIFFNSALVFAANQRLEGGQPTLSSGLKGASDRIGAIFAWSVVSATVSVVLRAIEERVGFIGRIVMGLFGMAWSLITFLVIPLLVVEGVGVRDALSKSGEMFKRTWGENVLGQIGFGLIGFLLVLPAVLLIVAGAALGGAMLAAAVVLGTIWFVVIGLALAAMNGIFQTALYRYASGKPVGSAFTPEMLAAAFPPRK